MDGCDCGAVAETIWSSIPMCSDCAFAAMVDANQVQEIQDGMSKLAKWIENNPEEIKKLIDKKRNTT